MVVVAGNTIKVQSNDGFTYTGLYAVIRFAKQWSIRIFIQQIISPFKLMYKVGENLIATKITIYGIMKILLS